MIEVNEVAVSEVAEAKNESRDEVSEVEVGKIAAERAPKCNDKASPWRNRLHDHG